MADIKYTYDALGNITKAQVGDKVISPKDVPEYNVITGHDDMAVVKAKQKAQREKIETLLK